MSLGSYLISLTTIIFWIFRIAVAFSASMNIEFIVKPLDLTVEIVLLFVTLVSIILIFKRSMIGALMYLISYFGYFGVYIYNIIQTTTPEMTLDYINIIVSALAILIAFIVFVDVGFSRSSKKTNKNIKKTDWYYQNSDYDRKYDERADKNQYKL